MKMTAFGGGLYLEICLVDHGVKVSVETKLNSS